ncbi:MAG: hypothetical protein NW224_01365 [Leptolyngbyaceae cyanobacterium bins.302]|nr:hypothetical protein [Leptolyngbyaceae cyanobacterium bins.302]
MQSQPKLQTTNNVTVGSVDNSIAGVFAGSGLSLFGFLILIALLA